jgi:hypothetical protein
MSHNPCRGGSSRSAALAADCPCGCRAVGRVGLLGRPVADPDAFQPNRSKHRPRARGPAGPSRLDPRHEPRSQRLDASDPLLHRPCDVQPPPARRLVCPSTALADRLAGLATLPIRIGLRHDRHRAGVSAILAGAWAAALASHRDQPGGPGLRRNGGTPDRRHARGDVLLRLTRAALDLARTRSAVSGLSRSGIWCGYRRAGFCSLGLLLARIALRVAISQWSRAQMKETRWRVVPSGRVTVPSLRKPVPKARKSV